jgi:uncharacterized protein (DUF1778 family)
VTLWGVLPEDLDQTYGNIPYSNGMATTPLKSARLEFRVTDAQKKTIEAAAAIEGRTVTDFSADTLVTRAEEVVQRDRELRVDADRFDAFLKIMDRPARPIDGLRDLMSRESVFGD